MSKLQMNQTLKKIHLSTTHSTHCHSPGLNGSVLCLTGQSPGFLYRGITGITAQLVVLLPCQVCVTDNISNREPCNEAISPFHIYSSEHSQEREKTKILRHFFNVFLA